MKSLAETASDLLLSFDFFPYQYKLNFGGQRDQRSCFGLLVSLTIAVFTVFYTLKQVDTYQSNTDFELKQAVIPDHYDASELLDLAELDFKVAFSLINQSTLAPLQNAGYVSWKVYLETSSLAGATTRQQLSTHVCDNFDFYEFFGFSPQNQVTVSQLRLKNSLICLDRQQSLQIRGNSDINSVRLSFRVEACDWTDPSVTCEETTFEALQQYLSQASILTLYNTQRLSAEGEITNTTTLFAEQINKAQPYNFPLEV